MASCFYKWKTQEFHSYHSRTGNDRHIWSTYIIRIVWQKLSDRKSRPTTIDQFVMYQQKLINKKWRVTSQNITSSHGIFYCFYTQVAHTLYHSATTLRYMTPSETDRRVQHIHTISPWSLYFVITKWGWIGNTFVLTHFQVQRELQKKSEFLKQFKEHTKLKNSSYATHKSKRAVSQNINLTNEDFKIWR